MVRVLVTGASRGIGAAISRAFARNGKTDAIIAVTARSLSEPSHADLQGTLTQTVRDIESYGACGIPLPADLRSSDEVVTMTKKAIATMGGVDVVVNNASALYLDRDLAPKRMDILHAINARATLLINQTCSRALKESRGSIISMSPSVHLASHEWLAAHPAYTMSKYAMTMATLAFASNEIRANCLWPRYTVSTSATKRVEKAYGMYGAYNNSRSPEDVADAVYALACSTRYNRQTLYDDEIVALPTPPNAVLDLFAKEDVRSLCKN